MSSGEHSSGMRGVVVAVAAGAALAHFGGLGSADAASPGGTPERVAVYSGQGQGAGEQTPGVISGVPTELGKLTLSSTITDKVASAALGCQLQNPLTEKYVTAKEKACAQKLAVTIIRNSGLKWGASDIDALKTLWNNESGWSSSAKNPHSTALGIPQALNTTGNKNLPTRLVFGAPEAPYASSTASQIRWGMKYILERYGNPSNALQEWEARCGSKDGCWY